MAYKYDREISFANRLELGDNKITHLGVFLYSNHCTDVKVPKVNVPKAYTSTIRDTIAESSLYLNQISISRGSLFRNR